MNEYIIEKVLVYTRGNVKAAAEIIASAPPPVKRVRTEEGALATVEREEAPSRASTAFNFEDLPPEIQNLIMLYARPHFFGRMSQLSRQYRDLWIAVKNDMNRVIEEGDIKKK